jgi:hypothetical protein
MDENAYAGQAGKVLGGDVAQGSYSVLMKFDKLGTGYWSVPVGVPDPTMGSDISWSATVDFAPTLPLGNLNFDVVAMDKNGVPGPINQTPFIIKSRTPTGVLVISLAWDSAADLDLHVHTPDGFDLNPKYSSTDPDAGTSPGPHAGVINRDSNVGCVQDGFREEDAYWKTSPVPGTYLIYVDMFAACGAASADFKVTVTEQGKVTNTVPGRLLASDADGATTPGLFVLQLNL